MRARRASNSALISASKSKSSGSSTILALRTYGPAGRVAARVGPTFRRSGSPHDSMVTAIASRPARSKVNASNPARRRLACCAIASIRSARLSVTTRFPAQPHARFPRLSLDRAQGQAQVRCDHVLGRAAVQAQEQDLRADRADSAQALEQLVAVGQLAAHRLLALAQAQLHDLALGFPALLAMPVIVDQDRAPSSRGNGCRAQLGRLTHELQSASPTGSSVCKDTLGL